MYRSGYIAQENVVKLYKYLSIFPVFSLFNCHSLKKIGRRTLMLELLDNSELLNRIKPRLLLKYYAKCIKNL
jgi:hypothetical protein